MIPHANTLCHLNRIAGATEGVGFVASITTIIVCFEQ
jgi:hypothetical protein